MKIDGNIGGGPDGSKGGNFPEVVGQATAAQLCGLDGVWSTEVSRNPFLPLLVAAQAAPNLTVGTAIAVAFATNPMSMASLAYDMQSYTQGRFILGVGSQIRPHIERRFSMPWSAPADRMSEFIQALRAIWASWADGTALKFDGRFYTHTLMTPMFTPPPHPWSAPPVLVAAVGNRMTEVRGAGDDGVPSAVRTSG
jgi:probable F420-dependent oxidoreductase